MKKRNSKKVVRKSEGSILKYFFLGIVLVVVIQAVFMLGGLIIENNIKIPITGIPSAIGLTLVLIIGLLLYRKSEFILLGSFTLAFLSPLILVLIQLFGFMSFKAPELQYSTGYMTAMILIIWIYYINKILRKGL